jgi:hypothetical protein
MVFLSLPKKAGPETVNEIISQTWAGGSFRGDSHTCVHTRASTLGLGPPTPAHCGSSLSHGSAVTTTSTSSSALHPLSLLCHFPQSLGCHQSQSHTGQLESQDQQPCHALVVTQGLLTEGCGHYCMPSLVCHIALSLQQCTKCHTNGFHKFNLHTEPQR